MVNESVVGPDFGAGLSLDELVGMTAWSIDRAVLPKGEVFQATGDAAAHMVRAGLGTYLLAEIWADGHTVWHASYGSDPVIVTPQGKLLHGQK
jgi:hypothetical protein